MPQLRANKVDDGWRDALSRRSLLVVLLVSLVGWYLFEPMVLRREFDARVRSDQALSELSLEWTKRGDSLTHGVWLDDDDVGLGDLEIRPSGKPSGGGTGFEFWLYTVKDGRGEGVDLKRIVARGDPERVSAGWIPFEQGPGIVYTGTEPGFIKIPIETRRATISHALTPMGGEVEFRFRDRRHSIDTYSEANRSGALVVPSGGATADAIRVAAVLPTYHPRSLSLRWKGPTGVLVTVEDPRLVLDLLGWRVVSRGVGVSSESEVMSTGEGGASRWAATGASPQVRLDADLSAGLGLHVLGWSGSFLGLVLARLAVAAGWIGWCRIRSSPRGIRAVVLGVLVGVNLLIAVSFPMTVTSDGIDYIDGAAGLAFKPHTLERIPLYKAPGLMFVLAVCMRLGRDFLLAFAVVQAMISVAASMLAYVFVKERLGWRWATAAAFVVGIHPVLVTYQTYLLRENLASMLYLAVGVGFVVLERPAIADSGRRSVWTAAVIGLVCGMGALLRENFQILLLAAPVAVAWIVRGTWGRRGALAGVTLGVAFLTLLPYLAVKTWPQGAIGVVSGKTQGNRALNVWTNGVADGNDTAFLARDEWLELRDKAARDLASDFDFVNAMRDGDRLAAQLTGDSISSEYRTASPEPVMKQVADEAIARNPLRHLRGIGVSFLNQIGLWNFYDPPDAAGAAWYSRALRGRVGEFSTNYQVGRDWIEAQECYRAHQGQILDLVRQTTHSQETLRVTPWNSLFNEFFWFVHFLRPVVAVMFLLGIYRSVRRGERAIAAIGLTTLFMIGMAAAVVAPSPDRFSAPFIPVLVCVALCAAVAWRDGNARESAAA